VIRYFTPCLIQFLNVCNVYFFLIKKMVWNIMHFVYCLLSLVFVVVKIFVLIYVCIACIQLCINGMCCKLIQFLKCIYFLILFYFFCYIDDKKIEIVFYAWSSLSDKSLLSVVIIYSCHLIIRPVKITIPIQFIIVNHNTIHSIKNCICVPE